MKQYAALLAAAALLSAWPAVQPTAARQTIPRPGAAPFKRSTIVVTTPATLFDLLRIPKGDAQPRAFEPPRVRGGLEVFQSVAPAVVVVRTSTGHGTGFIVDATGTVVTNHHVVASGLTPDPVMGASFAMVHLGHLDADGTMKLLPAPVKAYLHKVDPTRDLAVLRLAEPVPGLAAIPYLTLSDVAPRTGQDCAIVGHPSSGMLWTMRPGQVAAVGQMPTDLVNVVMLKLASSVAERESLAAQLKLTPTRRIILTSAQANPGDSGGPVVDSRGRVIAVTFGGPGRAEESKFTYHVHLDELKSVLADVPRAPMLLIPDPWALGPRVDLQDIDGDGRADVLLAGTDAPETMLFDVANATPAAAARPDALADLVAGRKWRFQVGFKDSGGEMTAFYDTDNDGQIDLVMATVRQDGIADGRFVRAADGRWQYEAGRDLPLLDGRYLKDSKLAERADRMVSALMKSK